MIEEISISIALKSYRDIFFIHKSLFYEMKSDVCYLL